MTEAAYSATTAPPAHPLPPLIRGKTRDARAAVRWPEVPVMHPPTPAVGGSRGRPYTRLRSGCTLEKHARNRAETTAEQRENMAGCSERTHAIARGAGRSTRGHRLAHRCQSDRNRSDNRSGHLGKRDTTGRLAGDRHDWPHAGHRRAQTGRPIDHGPLGSACCADDRRPAGTANESTSNPPATPERCRQGIRPDREGIGRQCTARGHTRPTEAR